MAVFVGCGPKLKTDGAETAGQSGSTAANPASDTPGADGPDSGDPPSPPVTSGPERESTSDIGDTTGSDAVDEAGADFITPPDLGSRGDGEACVPAAQNCGEGFKCVWYVAEGSSSRRNDARCIPVTGERGPFESCSLPNGFGPDISDDCGPESYCLEVYQSADHGFCAPFADGGCADYPGTNAVVENGSDFPAACLLHPCHPLISDTCPEETRCMFYPASLYATTACWKEETPADLPLGASCDFGGCGEGRLCAPNHWLPGCEHDRCCAQWCDVEDAAPCSEAGTACERLYISQATDESFSNVGACVLPGALE